MLIMGFWEDFGNVLLYGDTKKNIQADYQKSMAEESNKTKERLTWGLLISGTVIILAYFIFKPRR